MAGRTGGSRAQRQFYDTLEASSCPSGKRISRRQMNRSLGGTGTRGMRRRRLIAYQIGRGDWPCWTKRTKKAAAA